MTIEEKKRKISELVQKIKGDRSIRQMARESNVSPTIISDIINERYLITAKMIDKITTSDANPQNSITKQDLMIAAGYQISQETIERNEAASIIEGNILGSIINKLAIKDFKYQITQEKDLIINTINNTKERMRFDLMICTNDQEWFLEIIPYRSNSVINSYKFDRAFYSRIGRIVLLPPDPNRKISVVVLNEDAFNHFTSRLFENCFKGNLSIILVDEETFQIKDEKYLAYYDEKSKKKAFTII